MANLKTSVPIDSNLLIHINQSNHPNYTIKQHDRWNSIYTGLKSHFTHSGIVNINDEYPKKNRIGLEPWQPFATLILDAICGSIKEGLEDRKNLKAIDKVEAPAESKAAVGAEEDSESAL